MAKHTDASIEPARSEATRQRMLDAALRLFSREGFDAVSTRSLANAAQVNQAAIPYHFQSKEGLYHAVAHRIVEMVRPFMEPTVNAVRERHGDGIHDLELAREDIVRLVLALLRKMVVEPNYEIGYFMLREQMQPTAALDILYDNMIQPLHELIGRLVAALRGKPETDPDVIIEVQALYGEAVVFGAYRTILTRRLGIDDLGEEHLDRISRAVRTMIIRQFPLKD